MSDDVLTFDGLRAALGRVADRLEAARDDLCALDAIAGDGELVDVAGHEPPLDAVSAEQPVGPALGGEQGGLLRQRQLLQIIVEQQVSPLRIGALAADS